MICIRAHEEPYEHHSTGSAIAQDEAALDLRSHAAGAQHPRRNLRRLGARRHGRDGLQLRHPHADRRLAHQQGTSGHAGHGGAADFCRWRMARRACWPTALAACAFCRSRSCGSRVFTFLSGFTNSFWQLLITRGLQGLGFGGEWAVGSVLMGEAIRAEYRGKAVGTVQGGWAIGWGITAISYTVLFSVLPADDGLARHVLDRHSAGASGLLHPAQCSRAGSLPPDARARSQPR